MTTDMCNHDHIHVTIVMYGHQYFFIIFCMLVCSVCVHIFYIILKDVLMVDR